MNQTPNYQLSQWEASDRIQRADFNADNAKIDAAISAAVTRFATGTYQGTGEYGAEHPNSLTFDFPPQVVIVQNGQGAPNTLFVLMRGADRAKVSYTSRYSYNEFETLFVTWNGNTVSWYTSAPNNTADQRPYVQGNQADATYHYLAIG